MTLRTSFIVGFPGETENEFEELCHFVRELRIRLDGRIRLLRPGRRRRLCAGQQSSDARDRATPQTPDVDPAPDQQKKKKTLVGREFDLLLEGESEETDLLLEGRTAMHAPEIDGKVFVNDFPEGSTRSPAISIAAKSPKPTTTISSHEFCEGGYHAPQARSSCTARSARSLSKTPTRTFPSAATAAASSI